MALGTAIFVIFLILLFVHNPGFRKFALWAFALFVIVAIILMINASIPEQTRPIYFGQRPAQTSVTPAQITSDRSSTSPPTIQAQPQTPATGDYANVDEALSPDGTCPPGWHFLYRSWCGRD